MNTDTAEPPASPRALEPETVLPPRDGQEMGALAAFLDTYHQQGRLVAPDGTATTIPAEVYTVLADVVEAMRQGKAITVAPVSQRLTTSQAADLIGVSRPTLVKLLDEGEIPYEQPRRHRLVRLDDVLAYQRRRRATRRALLDEATRQATADGLYDTAAGDYAAALQSARRQSRNTTSSDTTER